MISKSQQWTNGREMYSHHNNSITMQRNLSSSGREIHVLVDLQLIDFVAGEFDSFGFGSE
jgi:hypothetical protein